MNINRIHTPDGVNDILQQETLFKRGIESRFAEVFSSYGYFEVQTPSYEFMDVFSGSDTEELIKFIDTKGRVLALRPDITTGIARIAATKLSHSPFPKRLYYIGNAFRDSHAYQGVLQNEFTQAGLELLGSTSLEADAEVIAAAIEALLCAGLKDFQMEIGHAEFFKGLMEQSGLDDQAIEEMRYMVDRKSLVGIAELAAGHSLDEQVKQAILNLPNQFGGIEVINNQKGVGNRAQKALDQIKAVYDMLADYGYEEYISIDLGMVQGINYYTGIITKGFAGGMGFPICGGGRYDNLIGEFGESIPATGIAIGVDRVMAAIGAPDYTVTVDTIVKYEAGQRSLALKICKALRANGVRVQLWVDEGDPLPYAKDAGVGGIVHIKSTEDITVTSTFDGAVSKTTIFDLTGADSI